MEMLAEQASSLGLSAKKMQRALDDYAKSNGDPRRTQAVADAVQAFFIQREMMGMTDQDYVIDFFKIPGLVLARVGAISKDG